MIEITDYANLYFFELYIATLLGIQADFDSL